MTENIIKHKHDDYLVTAVAKEGLLRCVAVRSTKLVKEAREIHDLSPASTVALGRFMTGALLMASDFKNNDNKLSATIKSDGDISNIVVVADYFGNVRGDINNKHAPSYYHHEGKLNIGKSIGKGNLTIIKDLGLKEPYVGSVELASGEIAEDLASYYFYSEQIPTVIFLGVRLNPDGVVSSGGLLVQALPGVDDELLDWLESRAMGFPDISELLENKISPHQLIDLLIGEDVEYLAEKPVQYYCPSSKERMEKNLISLGEQELKELAEDKNGINLHCHFCSEDYHFSQSEVKAILEKAKLKSQTKINIIDNM